MKTLLKVLIINSMFMLVCMKAIALESIAENTLRDVTGQEGIRAELNYKATIGRAYFETTDGDLNDNSFNLNNISFDTDGTHDSSGIDRPIKMDVDVINNGFVSGLGIQITEVNDLDIVVESVTVASGDVSATDASYGGFSLTNINDNGGFADVNILAKGADGTEGLRINVNLAEKLSLNWAYTDNGPASSVTTDDYSLSANVILSNVSGENNIDVVGGEIDEGSLNPVGGLRLNIVSLSGDITLDKIQAGDTSTLQGSMGRIEINNYQLSPESYLTVQGI
jgi:hypothetical protein